MKTTKARTRLSTLLIASAVAFCFTGATPAVIVVLAGTLAATHSAMAAVNKVYWTDRDNATLSVTDLSSGQTQVLVANTGGRLQDVDLDTSTGILYFADWGPVGPPGSQGSINQVNRDGTGLATVFNTNDAVHQLALDQAIQRIYFTRAVSYDNHEISHVTTAGAGYTVSFLTGGFDGPGWFPSGLAHDPVNDILYWGDIGVIFNPPNGSVNQMTASTLAVGPLPTQLTPHVDGRGRGYALDQASQTIFLTAHDPQSPGTGGGLFSYDIVNNIETQLISDTVTGYWDIEIDPVGQRIWWTDYGRGQIRSAKFDGSDVRVELSNLTNPYGLALEIVQPVMGGCCDDSTGTCTIETESDCLSLSLRFGGDGSDCSTINPPCLPPPPPTGACCDDSTGTCTDGVTEMDCLAAGLRFGGVGSDCATIDPPCGPAVLFLAIDEDSIDNGTNCSDVDLVPVNEGGGCVSIEECAFFSCPGGPYDPSPLVGDDDASIPGDGGNCPLILGINGIAGLAGMPPIWLPTGQIGDEGLFSPAIGAFVGMPGGLPGYVNCDAAQDEHFLDGLAGAPLDATSIFALEGRRVCAVVHDSDISDLDSGQLNAMGARSGRTAFDVIGVIPHPKDGDLLPVLLVEFLDATEVDAACECENLETIDGQPYDCTAPDDDADENVGEALNIGASRLRGIPRLDTPRRAKRLRNP